MTLLYLSIPLMLVGLSLALVPLVWAMAQDQRARELAATTAATTAAGGRPDAPDRYESVAA